MILTSITRALIIRLTCYMPFYTHDIYACRWCPESVKWCLSKGRVDQARAILRLQAKANGCAFDENLISSSTMKTYTGKRSTANGVQSINTKTSDNSFDLSTQVNESKNHSNHATEQNPKSYIDSHEMSTNVSPSQWQQMRLYLSTPRLLMFLGVLSYTK